MEKECASVQAILHPIKGDYYSMRVVTELDCRGTYLNIKEKW